jgi:hypothetical protein
MTSVPSISRLWISAWAPVSYIVVSFLLWSGSAVAWLFGVWLFVARVGN